METTIETYEDGKLVATTVVEIPDPEPTAIDGLRDALDAAKTGTTAQRLAATHALLDRVLDVLDPNVPTP